MVPDKILIEYQKAQDSAEHYNTMTWTLISIGIGLSLLLIKTALFDIEEITNNLLDSLTIQSMIFFLGSSILAYFNYLIRGADQKKKLKYSICQKIEVDYNFLGQNIGTEFLPFTKARWGILTLNIMTLILMILFSSLSVLVCVRALNHPYFHYMLLLFIAGVILSIVTIVTNFLGKGGKVNFEDVLKNIERVKIKWKK